MHAFATEFNTPITVSDPCAPSGPRRARGVRDTVPVLTAADAPARPAHPGGPAGGGRRPRRRRRGRAGRAARHRQDHGRPARPRRRRPGGSWSPNRAGSPPAPPPAGWPTLLGEQVGERVGYTVRGDRKVGPRTVVEVVTTGVLVRRLHRDPELAGTAVVILDECHERHLDSDLALRVPRRGARRPAPRPAACSPPRRPPSPHRLAEVLGARRAARPR